MTTAPPVQFLRVLGMRSKDPTVLARAGDALVRWKLREGWTCDCDTPGETCDHVTAVAALVHPRVLGGTE